jgi:hypothetical protein
MLLPHSQVYRKQQNCFNITICIPEPKSTDTPVSIRMSFSTFLQSEIVENVLEQWSCVIYILWLTILEHRNKVL